jgi:hypothetical protein
MADHEALNKEEIASVTSQVDGFDELNRQRQQAPDRKISLTDPDARSMATNGRGTGMVGYKIFSDAGR